MLHPLVKSLNAFLKRYELLDKRLLLGFSGGPDSLALLHLLLESGVKDLHLAHIDHGWREESHKEAKMLAEMAKLLKLPFHIKRCKPTKQRNLEKEARAQRLTFFSKIYQELDCQGLFLAHHADDQSETVLKRILEGADLFSSAGMKALGYLEGMQVFRPLLNFPKRLIKEWLDAKGKKGIEDATNLNPAFLRARMRTQILPSLREAFGKNIDLNLLKLGHRLSEVEEMLEGQVQNILTQGHHGPLGFFLEIPTNCPRLLLRTVLSRVLRREVFFLSYEAMEGALSILESRLANKRFLSKEKTLILDRGSLFLFSKLPSFSSPRKLAPGNWRENGWEWEMSLSSSQQKSSWKDLWVHGAVEASLASGEYTLFPAETRHGYRNWWNMHKVPAFMRSILPLVGQKDAIVHEFLTGKSKDKLSSNNNELLHIKLKLINN